MSISRPDNDSVLSHLEGVITKSPRQLGLLKSSSSCGVVPRGTGRTQVGALKPRARPSRCVENSPPDRQQKQRAPLGCLSWQDTRQCTACHAGEPILHLWGVAHVHPGPGIGIGIEAIRARPRPDPKCCSVTPSTIDACLRLHAESRKVCVDRERARDTVVFRQSGKNVRRLQNGPRSRRGRGGGKQRQVGSALCARGRETESLPRPG